MNENGKLHVIDSKVIFLPWTCKRKAQKTDMNFQNSQKLFQEALRISTHHGTFDQIQNITSLYTQWMFGCGICYDVLHLFEQEILMIQGKFF
jgi:hypothetical protein